MATFIEIAAHSANICSLEPSLYGPFDTYDIHMYYVDRTRLTSNIYH